MSIGRKGHRPREVWLILSVWLRMPQLKQHSWHIWMNYLNTLDFVGYINENRVRHLLDRFQDTRAGHARPARVNTWCLNRQVDRGIAGFEDLSSLYRTHRPDTYRGFDESVKETATRWSTPIAGRHEAPPNRPWSVFSPRALGCTCFEVLTEFVDHNMTDVTNINRNPGMPPLQTSPHGCVRQIRLTS